VEKAAPGPPTLRELADANFVAEAIARELQRLTAPPPSSRATAAASVLDTLARERYGGPSGATAEARLVTLHSELDKAVYHLAHSMQLRCVLPRLVRRIEHLAGFWLAGEPSESCKGWVVLVCPWR
jgi:hypothetical protein